jgi:hypothetical protein
LLVGHYKGTQVEEPDIVKKVGYCLLHVGEEKREEDHVA